MVNEYLYWFREDSKRELKLDVEWATERFRRKFSRDPKSLLVNKEEFESFVSVESGLNIKCDFKIPKNYFGVL